MHSDTLNPNRLHHYRKPEHAYILIHQRWDQPFVITLQIALAITSFRIIVSSVCQNAIARVSNIRLHHASSWQAFVKHGVFKFLKSRNRSPMKSRSMFFEIFVQRPRTVCNTSCVMSCCAQLLYVNTITIFVKERGYFLFGVMSAFFFSNHTGFCMFYLCSQVFYLFKRPAVPLDIS